MPSFKLIWRSQISLKLSFIKFYVLCFMQKLYYQGAYHHVYNRGAAQQKIFRDQQDYGYFLRRLRYYKNKYNLSIFCYSLMPTHFHFGTKQLTEKPLWRMMQFLTNGYAMHFNKKYKTAGHLFESRFKAILIKKEEYFLHLSRYIHLNPVIAKLVKNLEDWPWSSYLDYIDRRKGTLCDKKLILELVSNSTSSSELISYRYKEFVESDIERMFKCKEAKKLMKLIEGME